MPSLYKELGITLNRLKMSHFHTRYTSIKAKVVGLDISLLVR